MPQATVNYKDQISTILPSAANSFAIAAVCAKGDPTRAYTFETSQIDDVNAAIGDGIGCEAVVTMLRYGKRTVTFFPLSPTVAGSIGAITPPNDIGTPIITAAAVAASGDVLIDGPYDSLQIAIKITRGGAEGVAQFQYSLDDQVIDGQHVGTWSGDITVPIALAAEIVGTVSLTPSALFGDGGTLDTKTFIVDSDSDTAATTTFADPANAAAVASQVDTVGASTKFNADIVGASKLRVTSATIGAAGTLAIGAGTANAALGFTNGATATGSAATYVIPGVGVKLTFPSGTYTANRYYTFSTTAPRIAAAAVPGVTTRIQNAISSGGQAGAVWIVQEDADAIDSRTMMDAFSAGLVDTRTAKFSLWGLYQVAKSASDADVVTRCGSFEDRFLAVSAGDFYAMGGALPGSRFHRPWSWWAAWKAARDRFSSDLGNHSDGKATTENGFTALGRDERTATTKLATFRTPQTGSGGGFLVAESTTFGEVFTYQGRTMAASGSIYGDLAAVRLMLAVSRQMQRDLDFEINNDFLLTKAGALDPSEVDRVKNRLEAGVNVVLFEDPETPEGHASAFAVSDPVYTKSTKTLSASYEVQRRGPAKAVVADLAITDTLSSQGA